jgi:hypothetical protein
MSLQNWRLELKKQIAIAIVALGTAIVTPAAMAANVAASTVKPTPVVVTNPVTIANPVSTVTVGNTVPVTGTVNIGTLPSVKVDTTTPLDVKHAKVYSTTVNLSMQNATSAANNYDRVFVTLPAPAILETITANCYNSASGFWLGGDLATSGTALPLVSQSGNFVETWNGFNGLRYTFPSVGGVSGGLPPTLVNLAVQSVIRFEVLGDLLQTGLTGMQCIFTLTLRELN